VIFYYEMGYHLWEFYLLWNMSGIWTSRVNFGCKLIERFRFWSLKTFDYWKLVCLFFHFISIRLFWLLFFTISSSMSLFPIKFDLYFFYCYFFFFSKFFKLIFFSQSHHSKLNWLGIKFLDWTRFKDFMISMVVGFAG
jgi:hypothetical protein